MSWLKSAWAWLKSAVHLNLEVGGLKAIFSWAEGVRVWAWLKTATGALWRSFWAVWTNPATYPILGALAFASFLAGHAAGHRRVPGLVSDLAVVAGQRNAAESRVKTAEKAAKDAADALASYKIAHPVVVAPAVAPSPVKAAAKKKPVRKSAAPAPGGLLSGLIGG